MSVKQVVMAAAGVGGGANPYIEDVFSTYLYTGNGSTQTITNGIDLAGEGGLVWIKNRNTTGWHILTDTERGANKQLFSNDTAAAGTDPNMLTSFSSSGFSIGDNAQVNGSTNGLASWTFRKAPKFFDVVTYTGNGSTQNISHNLGSTPGCIIVKCTSNAGQDWFVYHRTQGNGYGLLNTTDSWGTYTGYWNNTAPTDTQFSVGTSNGVNGNGYTYVAYLFAHDAGGFGDAGDQNVISCGSFTTDGNGHADITLNWEPQWVMFKRTDSSTNGDWRIQDNMRGYHVGSADNVLLANSSAAESTNSDWTQPLATGFSVDASGNASYIYIAIRRGPMKTPTDATSVFAASTYTGTGTEQKITSGLQGAGQSFVIVQDRTNGSASRVYDILRGPYREIYTQASSAEVDRTSISAGLKSFDMDGFTFGPYNYNGTNESGITYVAWQFNRAPGFFDMVCYTGTGSATTVAHNLGVAPEMMWVKCRSAGGDNTRDWVVYHKDLISADYFLKLNTTDSPDSSTAVWNSTNPTASLFSVGTSGFVNSSGQTYVAYLFASVPGVSKVGSYTGTGTTLQVNCGFSSGARFVLIKRAGSGDWYVWDSTRGIVSGNDPYLLLNSTAAEVTSTDYIDPLASGFEISSTAPAAINASGGSFIYLAIA